MKETSNNQKKSRNRSLLFSIIIIFSILGAIIFAVSRKISNEMSASAVQNLSESLDDPEYH